MEKSSVEFAERILIVSITPYFLEKGNFGIPRNTTSDALRAKRRRRQKMIYGV